MGISFNYMQNFALPHLRIQDTFYLRQLTVSVFGIHNIKTGKARYYIYHEGTCSKGANVVGTFLLDYIKSIPNNIKHLHVFSDNCYGQNRNHTIIRMFLLLAYNRFESVTWYFQIRGHSYMPNNRDFVHIKKELKTEDHLFTLKQIVRIIACVRNAEEIIMVKPEMIRNFNAWWPQFFKKNTMSLESVSRNVPRNRSNRKVNFLITKLMQFTYLRDGVIFAQPFNNSLVRHYFEMLTCAQSQKYHSIQAALKQNERYHA